MSGISFLSRLRPRVPSLVPSRRRVLAAAPWEEVAAVVVEEEWEVVVVEEWEVAAAEGVEVI